MGEDEDESKQALQESGDWERCQTELDIVEDMWDTLCRVANFDYVHDVETFVIEADIGYAGQFDLLYEDQQYNETVLADLKTSKFTYEKHLIQLAAYQMALPMSVDRLEVLRVNPDKEEWHIFPHTAWDQSVRDLQNEFIRLRDKLERQHLKSIVETVQDYDDTGAEPDGVMFEEINLA